MPMCEEIVHETDWLGANLVFYNLKTGKYDRNINNVYSKEEAELDEQGLRNYMKYGFSVFGDTPIKNVKFTLPNTKLIKTKEGQLKLNKIPDPILQVLDSRTSESEALDRIEVWVQSFHHRTCEKNRIVVLPLSGGLDSRLLAYFSRDCKNLQSFSYGISLNQSKSSEVYYGRKVAELANLKWQQITLGKFHNFLELNDQTYGPSMHSHSMYHFEFYLKIKTILGEETKANVLSGIYGDVWAGSWQFPELNNPHDLRNLAVTHGMQASNKITSNPETITERELSFFLEHKEELSHPLYRVVAAARMKMTLIRHLIYTPEAIGFEADSPFLDFQIASRMLTINQERRLNRAWQHDFLNEKFQLKTPKINRPSKKNVSDLYGTYSVPLPELSVDIDTPYELKQLDIAELNKQLRIRRTDVFKEILIQIPFVGTICTKFKIVRSSFSQYYADFMILYPLFSVFRK